MSQMSPLMKLLLIILRKACFAATGLMLVFVGLLAWQRHTGGGLSALSRQDITFLAILLGMGAAFLWMAIAIGKEIRRDSGS